MNTVIRVTRRATIVKLLRGLLSADRCVHIDDIAVVSQPINYASSGTDEVYYRHWLGLSSDNTYQCVATDHPSYEEIINVVHSLQNSGIPVLLVQVPSLSEDVLMIEISSEPMPIKVSHVQSLVS